MASHYRRFQDLSAADTAYIAGLIDGEGTVALARKHANENRHALTLLHQVHHYLQSYKRERSAMIRREYLRLTPRNGKYDEALRNERNAFVLAVMAIKPGGIAQSPVDTHQNLHDDV